MFFKKLIIIGAGGWGREILWSIRGKRNIIVKGFLDDNPNAFNGLSSQLPPILSSVEDYEIKKGDYFFCALGDPMLRKKCYEIIERKGGKFLSIISPKASICKSAKIGDGSFIDEYTCISDKVVIGKNCIVQRLATIGHDTFIEDSVTIGSGVFCGGSVKIGRCSIVNVNSTIIHSISVGENVVIGAGSVVMRNVKNGNHIFGNPAHILATIPSTDDENKEK